MQFIQVVKNAKFVICNDTGIYHIAVSENVPVTIITGGYAFEKYIIYDFESNIKYKKPYIVTTDNTECFNCMEKCIENKEENDIYPCLENISTDKAWKKVEKMINELNLRR